MKNEQLENLVNGIGALTEIWMVTYANFKNQKMTDDDAIKHTKAMMETIMASLMNNEKE